MGGGDAHFRAGPFMCGAPGSTVITSAFVMASLQWGLRSTATQPSPGGEASKC